MEKSGQIKTLNRAFDILFLLTESHRTLSVPEIAEKTNIPESTTYRLLQALEKSGLIERQSGQVSLGMKILEMSKAIHEQLDQNLLEESKSIMNDLTMKVDETSILVVRKGNVGVTIHHVDGSHIIGFVVRNGRTLPLHLGASGKAILAFEDDKFINSFLKEIKFENKEKLLTQLNDIKSKGFVKTIAEVDMEIVGIAAPIFDGTNRIAASLSIVGPKDRFNEEIVNDTIKHVTTAANKITNRLSR